jgi:hypothetical protein
MRTMLIARKAIKYWYIYYLSIHVNYKIEALSSMYAQISKLTQQILVQLSSMD